MKKFAILALTAAFTLNFAAFSLSACGNGGSTVSTPSSESSEENNTEGNGNEENNPSENEEENNTSGNESEENNPSEVETDESDVVTDEEWLAVMNSQNYNFTIDFDLSILTYDTNTGELDGSTLQSGTVYCDLAADEDGVITGTMYETLTVESSNPMQYEYYFVYEKDCIIQYIKYTAANSSGGESSDSSAGGNTGTSAAALTDEDDETEWNTICSAGARSSELDTTLLSIIPQLYIANYIGVYSLSTEDYFVYSEDLGAYVLAYSGELENSQVDYTYTVKIKDGYITSFGAASYVTQDGELSSESDAVYTCFDYGATTVTIPDDIQAEIDKAYEEFLSK